MLYRLIEWWHRLTAVFRRRRLERDLRDELDFHLAMREADLAGARSSDARAAALRRFGNRSLVHEELREMWSFPSVESVWHDVRYAVRTLRRAPGFAAVAILTLALGIGGTTAIFSLSEAASAGRLPYREPDRLVQLWGTVERDRTERRGASYLDFLDWRDQATVFDGAALFDGTTATLALDRAERIEIETVSVDYFRILGLTPALGRDFRVEDDQRGAAGVAVLSDAAWRRHFGADPALLGRGITLDGRPFTVIGIMPPDVRGLTDQAQLWIPFVPAQPAPILEERGTRGFVAIARLRPDASAARAQQELDTISKRLEQAYPDTNERRAVEVSPLETEVFGDLRPALRALLAAVALVLLIVCANVANLLLARAAVRRREIAVRAAIGASRRRLFRQLLTETCVLAGLGAVAGVALAHAALRLLVATSPVTLPSFAEPRVDAAAILFAAAVAAGCALVVGFAPAVHARSARLHDALKSAVSGGAGRLRAGLVVAEVSLAVVLLVGAGLMIRSVQNLSAVDPGFDPSSVLTVRVSLPAGAAGTPADNRPVLERVRAVPGVDAASLASDVPLEGSASAVFYAVEGQGDVTAQNRPRAYVHRVTPDFFATLRIPLLAGRTFAEAEIVPDTPVVIVTERLARRFWPGEDPIGRRLKFGDLQSQSPWRRVIGVVPDLKYRGLPDNPTADPDLFFPMLGVSRQVALVVRTTLPAASVAAGLRAAVQEVNPAIPVYNVRPLEELVGAQTARARFTTWLMGTFAVLALLLSAVGIFGVMSYMVAQRTREIGIRLALGAAPRTVMREVATNGGRLIACGAALGLLGAAGIRQLLASQLFQVDLIDPAAVLAVALLIVVALGACLVPARRATRIDPLVALRTE